MVRSLEAATRQIDETRNFVDRALRDFGLLEAFECRPPRERAECLRWIAASSDSCEEEDRVSCLLDALSAGDPLVPATEQRSRQTMGRGGRPAP